MFDKATSWSHPALFLNFRRLVFKYMKKLEILQYQISNYASNLELWRHCRLDWWRSETNIWSIEPSQRKVHFKKLSLALLISYTDCLKSQAWMYSLIIIWVKIQEMQWNHMERKIMRVANLSKTNHIHLSLIGFNI
jgi:hypothetical protein